MHTHVDDELAPARAHLGAFKREVQDEPWTRAHDVATQRSALENTLALGCTLFDLLIEADSVHRDKAGEGAIAHDPTFARTIRDLVQTWLTAAEKLASELAAFEREGSAPVRHADGFHTRRAEAVWILRPASEAFDDPRMVELRDGAIDELRARRRR